MSPTKDPPIARAFIGFVLFGVGNFLRVLGATGLRGSGVILDPEGARQDLKSWNQAAGGMLDDTLRSSEVATSLLSSRNDSKPTEIVKVRCPHCRTLNDEDAKFCDECGKPL